MYAGCRKGSRSEHATVLNALPTLYGEPRDVFRRARSLPLSDVQLAAVTEIEQVLATVRKTAQASMSVDLAEVRGFEYYTGLRLGGYARGYGRSLLWGGRYDDLLGRYGRVASAVGLAIDIEAIAEAPMIEDASLGQVDLALVASRRDAAQQVREMAARIRSSAGCCAAAYYEPVGELGALTRYCRAVGVSHMVYLDGKDWILVAASEPESVVARGLR